MNNDMYKACISGNIPKAYELIKLGIDLNVFIDIGTTIKLKTTFLNTAIVNEKEDMAIFLINNDAHLNEPDESYLLEACNSNMIKVVKILLEKGTNINENFNKNGHDMVPLLAAVIRGYYGLAVFLIENGADIHILNNICIKIARQIGNTRMILLLNKV